jgi:hypothetical protein
MKIFVLNKNGKPIMPTSNNGKVRLLLKEKKARVVRKSPFTIQLLYDVKNYTQCVKLGLDPGGEHVGISASTKDEELFCAQSDIRCDIREEMDTRRMCRRSRRNRKTRYRKPRFDNRKRAECWLTPTFRSKVNDHMRLIKIVCDILPISEIVLEMTNFDIQKMKDPNINGEEYQQGDKYGFENTKAYVRARDGHTCQFCGKKDTKLEVHHIIKRSDGGTDVVTNLVTLCSDCHKKYHRGEIEEKKFLKKIKPSLCKTYKGATAMNVVKTFLFREIQKNFDVVATKTYGYITKMKRLENGIEKSHINDAFCIADNLKAERCDQPTIIKLLRRHDRSLHKLVPMKGGIRPVAVKPLLPISGTRFLKNDLVSYKGKIGYISGETHNCPYVRDNEGTLVYTNSKGKKGPIPRKELKNVKLVQHNYGHIMMEMKQ